MADARSQREISEILRTFARSRWNSLQLSVHGMRLTVSKDGTPPAGPAPPPAAQQAERVPTAAPAPPPAPGEPPVEVAEGVVAVRSPAVGAFWVAPSPGASPFVQQGQTVEADEQLAIVEVMKLMNPVVAPEGGEVVQVCARNGELVEFDQVLFLIMPANA